MQLSVNKNLTHEKVNISNILNNWNFHGSGRTAHQKRYCPDEIGMYGNPIIIILN